MRHFSLLLGLSALGIALATAGCATTREGYVYDAKAPRKGSIVFQNADSKAGTLALLLADGEQCKGSFNTVPGIVQTDEETGRVDREESQTGLAILECRPGHVVRCGFQRDHGGAGYGHCSDTEGRNFDLYF